MDRLATRALLVLLLGACGAEPAPSNGQNATGGHGNSEDASSTPPAMDGSQQPEAAAGEASVPAEAADQLPDVPASNGSWDAWTKRDKITISDPELAENLTDFQVPVVLDAAVFDYPSAKTAGEDLRFVDAGGTVLHHQIDKWNAAGSSLIWLRVPQLTAASTTVWLYYGNKDAPALPDADTKAVWPEPYSGVWHLSGDSKDSTSNGYDGMEMVGGSYVDAKLATGLKLDGSKHDHITLKNDIKLVAGAAGCTFSAWINPTKIEDSINGMIIMTVGKWFNDNHNSYTDFNINAAGQLISHIDPGMNMAASGYSRILSDPGFIKVNEWAWVTYVIDLPAKEERFFKDGKLVSTKPPPAGKEWADAFIDMVSSRVVIGSEEDNISHWYTGSMDELRMEKGMRSEAWIAAQYRAMTVPGFVKVERDR
jgi:Concanavalin A-like lectin/glucanases superfamily/Domain of unknown function (DUF2341)